MADHALTFCHRTMSHTDAKNLAGRLQQCGSTISLAQLHVLFFFSLVDIFHRYQSVYICAFR
jgi:hypothetical protein